MTKFDEAVKLRAEAHRDFGKRKMFVGQRVSATQVRLSGAPAGRTWVRRDDASRENTAVLGYYGVVNHEVWVGPDANGNDTILDATENTYLKFGVAAVVSAMTPPKPAELNKDILPNENLQQFRVHPSSAGSLEVKIEPGYYYAPDGTLNITDLTTQDLSSSVPSASGGFDRFRWVKVSLDPANGAFAFTDGTPSVSITDIDLPALASIAIPEGEIPIYGVKLRTGQTSFDNPKEQFFRLDAVISVIGGGHEILIDDVPQTQRAGLNILSQPWLVAQGADDAGNNETEVAYTLDPAGVTQLTSAGLDTANDKLPIYDADANAIKYIVPDDLGVGGGGGYSGLLPRVVWEQKLSSPSTNFDTNAADTLGRTGIPSTAKHVQVVAHLKSSATGATTSGAKVEINSDTTASNYRSQAQYATNTTNTAGAGNDNNISIIPTSHVNVVAGTFAHVDAMFLDYNDTSRLKDCKVQWGSRQQSASDQYVGAHYVQHKTITAAISRIRIVENAGNNFTADSWVQIIVWEEASVGAADLDIGSIGQANIARGDKLPFGDVSNSDNTQYDTVENFLKLANDTLTSTATGNVDNLAIGNAPIVHLRFNNASDATLRGMQGSGKDGQIVVIHSVGAGNIYLAHQNSGSTADYRLINFMTVANTPIAAGVGTATYVYDATTLRWRMTAHEQRAAITYTPSWTSSGTAPSLVNGTLTGTYLVRGNRVVCTIDQVMGSSTTYGTGSYLWSLPISAASVSAYMPLLGIARARDNAPAVTNYVAFALRVSGTTMTATPHNGAQFGQTSPMTWAQDDAFTAHFEYEAG